MPELRAQLAPGWSVVNIAITVALFVLAWPLGLAMVAYVVWGRRAALDLGQPETFARFGHRLADAFGAGARAWRDSAPGSGTASAGPADGVPDAEALQREQDALAREGEHPEAEKNARSQQKESEESH